ncbi:MAG: RagB/SusD family nutrient uptake outer membrane protein [Bacteroidaceae bacterium]|nr:RagB/SusD family nutrient uptake outer membrane protein [Bacteroidaceae bacterium]
MNNIKYIFHIALAAFMTLSISSCNDWLTVYPQNKVVEEDFWEDKNDLNGVRYAAYTQMSNTISKFIVWGDLRSDSYEQNYSTLTKGTGTRDIYSKIISAQLDSTMSQYDWGDVYKTINYCNKVLSHGEEVLANDAQFTRTEWKQIKAEITALRALNYFYLIRAFKDIPYSTQVINSDKEVQYFNYTNQLDVLDTLIQDVESVKGQARNRFADKIDTKGLITNTAIYAILADMYLWRSALREGRNADSVLVSTDTTAAAMKWWEADAYKVIEYSQASIDALANQESLSSSTFGSLTSKTNDYGLSNSGIMNCNLIANEDLTRDFTNKSSLFNIDSYNAIFTNGNSSESIFEFQYNNNIDNRKNDFLVTFWGIGNSSQLLVSNNAIKKIYNDNETNMNQDSRTWHSATFNVSATLSTQDKPELNSPACVKYYNCTFSYDTNSNGISVLEAQYDSYSNFIFYRLADVMLMQAEAYAVLGGTANNTKCKAIVNAIHKRSTVNEAAAYSPGTTREDYITLVMNERQIELLGEGKRWFDLVRYAERIGGGQAQDPRETQYMDGATGVQNMVHKFIINTFPKEESAIKTRIKNRYGLYSPIYYKELKANKYIIPQNPVWNREK